MFTIFSCLDQLLQFLLHSRVYRHVNVFNTKLKIFLFIHYYCRRQPSTREFIGNIVGDSISHVPCGLYNQNDSCDMPLTHFGKNGEKRIHACALCYFTLRGMISLHRQNHCHLLQYVE